MNNRKSTFIRALHRDMPAILGKWCSAEQLDRDIGERLQVELDRCEDMGFATGFEAACPVEGCQPQDYLQRVVRGGIGTETHR